MLTNELVENLQTALMAQKITALVTITKHPIKTEIGNKCLLWDEGEIWSDSPLPHIFKKQLIEYSRSTFRRQKSKTISFYLSEEIESEVECFIEVYTPKPHLIVAGAGHVCEPVAEIGKMVGFHVTVIDDRAEYANTKRFPFVDEVVCKPYMEYFNDVPITSSTYILLITRGHQFDVISLEQLVNRQENPAYIGMIGSKRRISGVFEQLKQDLTNPYLDNIYAPIGLDIGAETPAEIAVSIMGEVLKVKNNRSGESLRGCSKRSVFPFLTTAK